MDALWRSFTTLMRSYYVYAPIFSLSSITVGHVASWCSSAHIMFMYQYICCLYYSRTRRFMMLMCSYYVYARIYSLSSITVGHVVLWHSCTHIMFMYQYISCLYRICWLLSACTCISVGRKYTLKKDTCLTNSLCGWCHFSGCGSHSSMCGTWIVFWLSFHMTV